jgi:hypothetical protein
MLSYYKYQVLALVTDVRKAYKNVSRRNTLAYLTTSSLKNKNVFNIDTRLNVIRLFTDVIYEC